MQTNNKVLKNVFYYSSSAYIAQILGILSNIVVARLLGPENFGIWNIVMLVLTYGTYSELGVLSAMGRDLSISLGQGDQEKASIINTSARYTTILSATLVGIGIFIFTYFKNFSPSLTMGLRAASVILILQQIYTYHRIFLRSYNCFKELSQQQIYFSFLTAILSISLVLICGFSGRLWGGILAHILILIYALYRNPWVKTSKFKFKECFTLMRIGIPIIISGVIITMLTSIDRLMIATFLDEKKLGYMSLSIMIVSIISVIPSMASQVLLPKFNYIYGSSGKSIEILKSYVFKTSKILSLIMPLVIGPLFIILPTIVSIFLKDYIEGITAARIVMVGFYFYGILGLTDSLLVTTGKLKLYGILGMLVLIINIALDLIFIKLGYGIEGVAFGGTMITYFIYSTILIGYAVSKFVNKFKDLLTFFVRIWSPFIYMVLILFITEKGFEYFIPTNNLTPSIFLLIFKLIIYIILCIPLVYFILNELNLKLSKISLKQLTSLNFLK